MDSINLAISQAFMSFSQLFKTKFKDEYIETLLKQITVLLKTITDYDDFDSLPEILNALSLMILKSDPSINMTTFIYIFEFACSIITQEQLSP